MTQDVPADMTLKPQRRSGSARTGGKPTASKKARLEALLVRPKGATMAQIEKSLGWQPHTVRAAISRLRKSGTEVSLDRSGKTPTYRIGSAT